MADRSLLLLLWTVGCGAAVGPGPEDAGPEDAGVDARCVVTAPQMRDCGNDACAALDVAGDPTATSPGMFKGLADPSLAVDPASPGRYWLAYSYPRAETTTDTTGATVYVGVVSSHLARSDDSGATFAFVSELWSADRVVDPEGSGEMGFSNSETASIAAMTRGGATRWFGVHMRYFQRPIMGYNPRYLTSWTLRVAAADSPEELAAAPEAVLGVTSTAAAYAPDARLDQLAGIPPAQCVLTNDPAVYADSDTGTLYLLVGCLAFTGTNRDPAHDAIRVYATSPDGDPSTWTWRHAGAIADASLAAQLGEEVVQQPNVSLSLEGTPLLLLTPASSDPSIAVGTLHRGCAAIPIVSLDPPTLARDCDGNAIVRARIAGDGVGSCTHASGSMTGLLAHRQGTTTATWSIRVSGLAL